MRERKKNNGEWVAMRHGTISGIQYTPCGLIHLRVKLAHKVYTTVAFTEQQFREFYSGVARLDNAFDKHSESERNNWLRGRQVRWSRNLVIVR